ncbi:hypothetical protein EG68_05315 [Paragonimus skrjabini miyazakii]|uniref:Uncharacterized protein n=1 Tax=Paragonimus skrjabini miyazakii TaxID=59628 RepID=A0A8S9YXX7_9TREM|nr:hypothetical protein EG68_05315 [Paragonimus skrjabini miyazakii]
MEFDLRLMRLGYFQPWGFYLRGGLSEPLTVEKVGNFALFKTITF